MISTVILTHHNGDTIAATIAHILPISSEVLIVDDYSTDDTVSQAISSGAKVITFPVSQNFSEARNVAMREAQHDWVLFLDADEILDEQALSGLSTLSPETLFACFRLKRLDYFWGQKVTHGEVWSAAHRGIIRLVNKKKGHWKGNVHEQFIPTGLISTLPGYLHHHAHQSVSDFLTAVNLYSTLRAEELQKKEFPKYKTFIQMITYPFGKFMHTYCIKLGVIDGAAGFVYSFMMSFHSFLVRAKLLTIHNQPKSVSD